VYGNSVITLICRGILARESGVVGPKVGKYSVQIASIENIGVPCLRVIQSNQRTFIIIDEIGMSRVNKLLKQAIQEKRL